MLQVLPSCSNVIVSHNEKQRKNEVQTRSEQSCESRRSANHHKNGSNEGNEDEKKEWAHGKGRLQVAGYRLQEEIHRDGSDGRDKEESAIFSFVF